MAWYYGTFSCGHDGRVNIIGPVKDREWKAQAKFRGVCEECYKKAKEEERLALLKLAEKIEKEYSFPELLGSAKQVEWAKVIRAKFYQEFQFKMDRENHVKRKERMQLLFNELIQEKVKATYWIDNRDYSIIGMLERFESEKKQRELEEKMKPLGIEKEAVIEPEVKKEEDAVEIRIFEDENKVVAIYRKNDIFNKVVKALGFQWDFENVRWVKNITEKTGSAYDRAAELAVKLLAEGIPVEVNDVKLREKIENQDYEPECFRWVDVREIGKTLYFELSFPYVANCYDDSRKIKGSKYDSTTKNVLIPKNQYMALLDFARVHRFKFTKNAKILLSLLKQREKEILANPKIKEEQQEFSMRDILNSSDEILPDLIDEWED